MKTPRETIQELCKQYYEYSGVGCSHQFDSALAELESYYVLSDDELRELLPRKRDVDGLDKVYWAKDIIRNNAIDDCFKALQGKVPKDNIFISHIQAHLKEGQEVICKICGKTAKEIIDTEVVARGLPQKMNFFHKKP